MSGPARLAGMTPRQVVDLGKEHGWILTGARDRISLRRTYLLPTPELVLCTEEEFRRQPFGKWDRPTYERHEFLHFYFRRTDEVDDEGKPVFRLRGQVLYRNAHGPWVGASDGTLTQRRALEILTAAPPADAIDASEATP